MKITIELSSQEVNGIKKYLKEDMSGGEKVTKRLIDQYVAGIVHGVIHAPQEAVSDFIAAEEQSKA